jgi:hypothetical protein
MIMKSITYERIPSMSLRAFIVREKVTQMDEMNVGRLETRLGQWGAMLDELVVKTEETGAEVKLG